MFENFEIFRMAQGLAQYASNRQSVVARNIANADTPGYRQQDLASFSETYDSNFDQMPLRATRAGHFAEPPSATLPKSSVVENAETDANGNSVSLETEIMKTAVIRQQHEMALSIYKNGLSVLRASLGRT
ncbi:FlgB family protein [Tropicimonas sp. IMCC34043]|uniref:FlgB family protein n=1 Tax=Tropicimonas sp. IMCC34043 TaxID=2248760 RepID=UPI000E281680|nr:FlgB family protein [Tropicimonas sp. IMCC34043]